MDLAVHKMLYHAGSLLYALSAAQPMRRFINACYFLPQDPNAVDVCKTIGYFEGETFRLIARRLTMDIDNVPLRAAFVNTQDPHAQKSTQLF